MMKPNQTQTEPTLRKGPEKNGCSGNFCSKCSWTFTAAGVQALMGLSSQLKDLFLFDWVYSLDLG